MARGKLKIGCLLLVGGNSLVGCGAQVTGGEDDLTEGEDGQTETGGSRQLGTGGAWQGQPPAGGGGWVGAIVTGGYGGTLGVPNVVGGASAGGGAPGFPPGWFQGQPPQSGGADGSGGEGGDPGLDEEGIGGRTAGIPPF